MDRQITKEKINKHNEGAEGMKIWKIGRQKENNRAKAKKPIEQIFYWRWNFELGQLDDLGKVENRS